MLDAEEVIAGGNAGGYLDGNGEFAYVYKHMISMN